MRCNDASVWEAPQLVRCSLAGAGVHTVLAVMVQEEEEGEEEEQGGGKDMSSEFHETCTQIKKGITPREQHVARKCYFSC